ncbi:hypothetical protein FRZ67_19115 [Panacibacter ginsenosidivorans]|uniref:Uncharacterized protein n=1 Tax=Panacibacter ginsenosidivorans TaxID=1813871 RepID=A0A5B8VCX2_9BACT|nr:hypothetical protein [Panacibacter ginsenosidivorans]QEC69314.1 hypothetical protein FRZ67_19115 [Panacibacter ginsenosidivorans]
MQIIINNYFLLHHKIITTPLNHSTTQSNPLAALYTFNSPCIRRLFGFGHGAGMMAKICAAIIFTKKPKQRRCRDEAPAA